MEPFETLGIWGDGDEYYAIQNAFDAIEVKLPVENAPDWITVGDLWNSVKRVAPDVARSSQSWDEFRRVISEETAVDWTRISEGTLLLDGRGHSVMQRLFFAIRERLGVLRA